MFETLSRHETSRQNMLLEALSPLEGGHLPLDHVSEGTYINKKYHSANEVEL